MKPTSSPRSEFETEAALAEVQVARLDVEVERLGHLLRLRRNGGAAEIEIERVRRLRDELATHALAARALLQAGAAPETAAQLVRSADSLRQHSVAPPAA